MRGCLKIAFLSIALAAAVCAGLAFWALRYASPPMPELPGKIERGALEHGGRMRTWIAYLPAKPATHPALVIALHGSMGRRNRRARHMGMTSISLRINMVSLPFIRRATKATGTIAA